MAVDSDERISTASTCGTARSVCASTPAMHISPLTWHKQIRIGHATTWTRKKLFDMLHVYSGEEPMCLRLRLTRHGRDVATIDRAGHVRFLGAGRNMDVLLHLCERQ